MTSKEISFIVVAIFAILGWNVFLIQRDNALYDAHYHRQAIENIERESRWLKQLNYFSFLVRLRVLQSWLRIMSMRVIISLILFQSFMRQNANYSWLKHKPLLQLRSNLHKLMKYLYIVDFFVPQFQSEYGGLLNVIAENDEECFDVIVKWDNES